MNVPSAVRLDGLELDALTELANIGVSRAAASLRKMVGDQVLLSVPSVAVMTREQAAELIMQADGDTLIAVHQAFEGGMRGRALLIFPESNSLELVRAVTGGELPLSDIVQLEQEALAETGNIILNGCLGTIGNILRRSLSISLPEVLRGTAAELFREPEPESVPTTVLFLYITFSVKQRDIQGYITLLMDTPAMSTLKVTLRELIRRIEGDLGEVHAAP